MNTGNALLSGKSPDKIDGPERNSNYKTDQQEYLEAGVDKYVLSVFKTGHALMLASRVLTKPVLERSLRDVLQCADERRKNINREANHAEAAAGDRPSPS